MKNFDQAQAHRYNLTKTIPLALSVYATKWPEAFQLTNNAPALRSKYRIDRAQRRVLIAGKWLSAGIMDGQENLDD